jgi:hypothetical protein
MQCRRTFLVRHLHKQSSQLLRHVYAAPFYITERHRGMQMMETIILLKQETAS